MLPCFFRTRNRTHLRTFVEKMKNNELSLENTLEEVEILQDLQFSEDSPFVEMLNFDNIRKLIDYSTKLPISEDPKMGNKYPFYSTKILCSNNNSIIDRIMNETYFEDDSDNGVEDEEEEKCEKTKKSESINSEKKEELINQGDNIIKEDISNEKKKITLYDNVDYL